jgi:hypothetical protein
VMTIADIQTATKRVPFRPFVIATADGATRTVRYPECISWDPDRPHVVHCVLADGLWEFIDLALVTSLTVEAPTSLLEAPNA